MEDWMEFSFCHFNDYRNVVEAWTRNPDITNQRVKLPVILLDRQLIIKIPNRRPHLMDYKTQHILP